MLASFLLVAAGGSLGAVARYATVLLSQALLGLRFPYGTLLVNGIGSFLAGFFMVFVMERLPDGDWWRLFVMVGFLGGFTTFSSYSWETLALYGQGDYLKAVLNIVANNVVALGLVFAGMHFSRWMGV